LLVVGLLVVGCCLIDGVTPMDLVTRAKNIMIQPAQEWRVIAGESTDIGSLIRDYAAPLSGVAAICQWLGLSVLFGVLGVGFVRTAVSAVVSWALGLLSLWVAAIAIEHLAPSFGSRGSTVQALKLVVYASTPVWIVGILTLVPLLGVLFIVAVIYAVYLFYLGLPTVLETPADRVVPYMLTSAVVVFIANFVVRAATRLVVGV
jgi:Yip1 domain